MIVIKRIVPLLVGLNLISITILTGAQQKTEFPRFQPKMAIPAMIKPETVTPAIIDKKNQEIITLKKQLASSFDKNSELQKLHKEKKEIKDRIAGINAMIQKSYTKNKETLENYAKAKIAKNIPKDLQSTVNSINQEIKNKQLELTQYYTKLQETKGALKRADPSRQNLLKKLHQAHQELNQMKLIQQAKTASNAKK